MRLNSLTKRALTCFKAALYPVYKQPGLTRISQQACSFGQACLRASTYNANHFPQPNDGLRHRAQHSAGRFSWSASVN